MEYIFGTVQRGSMKVENLKTVGVKHTNLTGYIETRREYDDGTVITDRFRVVEHYHAAESDGLCYDWYIIDSHYRYVENIAIAAREAQNAANIDYLSMMVGVDLPNAEGETTNG